MFDNRDFTVCENCGSRCYLGNKYCEDCANELLEIEYHINSDYCDVLTGNELRQKALELACETANYWWKECIRDKGTTSKDYNANEFLAMAKEKMKSE